jgi:6-phospho-beta-glucosidase
MVNFTNPSSIVTEAINKYGGIKAVGLCNVPIGMQTAIAGMLKVKVEEVRLDYVGLNHFSFIRKVTSRGKDVTQRVLKVFNAIPKAKNIKVVQYEQRFLNALGMVPNSYLQYYYLPDQMVHKIAKAKLTRAQEVMLVEKRLLKMFEDPKLDYKPKELEQRGGSQYSTTAVSLITALVSDTPQRIICNVPNNGALPDLPDHSIVEVPAKVSRKGVVAEKMGRMDAKIRGMVAQVKAYEELAVEAAVHMNYDMALMALANNPLVPSATMARGILDDLIKINKLKMR